MTNALAESPNYAPFVLVGVAHQQAGVAVREHFSLDDGQRVALLHKLRSLGAECTLVLGTCNRTEVFARHPRAHELAEALCEVAGAPLAHLERFGHLWHCRPALEKLFRIGCGLESQVLGDLQIVKQVKDAYQQACDHQLADATLHRVMQHLVRAHKRVRRETNLGKGAASIAGAAVQFVLQHAPSLHNLNLLLVGTGKMGKLACKNLLSHNPRQITLLNRTDARAQRLAERFQVRTAAFEDLQAEVAAADVVIVATGAQHPVLLPRHVAGCQSRKFLIDLSVPRNIAPEVAQLPNILLADLDALQAATDTAYADRLAAIPAAEAIVKHELENFENWQATQRVAPTIKALQTKFERIRRQEIDLFKHKLAGSDLAKVEMITERIVKKIAAHSIDHLRQNAAEAQVAEVVAAMFKLEPEETAEVG